MGDRVRRLRSRLAALSRGKAPRGVRYPVELRTEVVGLAREAHNGMTRTELRKARGQERQLADLLPTSLVLFEDHPPGMVRVLRRLLPARLRQLADTPGVDLDKLTSAPLNGRSSASPPAGRNRSRA